jgi:hypothetical protein
MCRRAIDLEIAKRSSSSDAPNSGIAPPRIGQLAGAGTQDFSFVLGGPLFQLLRRTHLSDDTLALLRRRVVSIALFAWLPLLLLAALQGQALHGSTMPFLKDFELHVRFLVAVPLLVVAEFVVHSRLQPTLRLLRERSVVPEAALPRLDAAVSSAYRLRNSLVAELLLVAFVYTVGIHVIWRQFIALNAATWYATPSSTGTSLTIAGLWYGYVSLPLFQFLLCRWYFRVFIWARFLWQVSRIDLSLIPTHPDRLGGLGFLGTSAYAFMPLAAAHGAMLAGTLANRIFYNGADLRDFKAEIALMVLFVLILVCLPLLVFASQLAAARRRGMAEYGTLAERYVREFDAKWLRGGAAPDEPLIGSADIQSLADLSNSVEIVRSMSTVPVGRDAIVRTAIATLVPLLPLLLTIMPLEELLQKLLGLLF